MQFLFYICQLKVHTLYRVIASFFWKTLNLAPRGGRARSHLSSEIAHTLWNFSSQGHSHFHWDGVLSIYGGYVLQGSQLSGAIPPIKCLCLSASLGFWECVPPPKPDAFSQSLSGLLLSSHSHRMCFSHGLLAFWRLIHIPLWRCMSLLNKKLFQFKERKPRSTS